MLKTNENLVIKQVDLTENEFEKLEPTNIGVVFVVSQSCFTWFDVVDHNLA